MAKKFVAPENLQDLEADALEAAVTEALARGKELRPDATTIPEGDDLEELRGITKFLADYKVENDTRIEAQKAIEAELADMDALLNEPAGGEEDGGDGEGEDGGETEGAQEGELVSAGEFAKDKKKVLPEDIADGGADDADEDPITGKKKKAPVKAAVKAPAFRTKESLAARAAKAAPAGTPSPMEQVEASAKVFAAADVPGMGGKQFSTLSEASSALIARLNSMPEGYQENVYQRFSGLQIQLPKSEFTTEGFKGKDITDLLKAAGDEKRLTGKSLVAAGGWGAPSERSLDFCEIESLDGLYTGPEITITRGGLEWTRGPHFGDVVNSSVGFWDMTEAVAEAGTELKTFIRPEVPEFQEARLGVVGVGMENGLLLRQGWPELVERWAKLTLMAHQYKLSQKKVAQIRALIGAPVAIQNGFGNALDIFHILEMLANGERQRLMLSPTQTLETLLPWWVKSVVRIDIANRAGAADWKSVTDAQIESEFTQRNLKVQWLKAFQDLEIDPTTGLVLKYPDTVEAIFYPAGAFVGGVSPVIALDTVYDSTLLKQNDYIHLFAEQGVLMTNPCYDGVRVTFPLYANGRRAVDNITNNFGNAVPA